MENTSIRFKEVDLSSMSVSQIIDLVSNLESIQTLILQAESLIKESDVSIKYKAEIKDCIKYLEGYSKDKSLKKLFSDKDFYKDLLLSEPVKKILEEQGYILADEDILDNVPEKLIDFFSKRGDNNEKL